MIDIHTHILPNMDDGSDSVATSIELLNILKNDGVRLICLTSHFYPSNESIQNFLIRRDESYKQLVNEYSDLDLRLGAEIHYYRGISASEDIGSLCIEGTNILLIELSFTSPVTDSMVNELIALSNKGYKIVLAHIERYDIDPMKIEYMHNQGILMQCNVEFINGLFTSRRAIKWLKNGIIDLLGSDCHNLTNRAPNYSKAINIIKSKLGNEFCEQFIENSYKIIE